MKNFIGLSSLLRVPELSFENVTIRRLLYEFLVFF